MCTMAAEGGAWRHDDLIAGMGDGEADVGRRVDALTLSRQ